MRGRSQERRYLSLPKSRSDGSQPVTRLITSVLAQNDSLSGASQPVDKNAGSAVSQAAGDGATQTHDMAAVALRSLRKDHLLVGPLKRAWHVRRHIMLKAGMALPGQMGTSSWIGDPAAAQQQLMAGMNDHAPGMQLQGAMTSNMQPGDALVGGGQGAGHTSLAQNPIGQYGLNDNGAVGTNLGQPMNAGGLKTAGEYATSNPLEALSMVCHTCPHKMTIKSASFGSTSTASCD